MTLEESKSKQLETLKEIKKNLQHRDFEVFEDLNIPEDPIRLNFNKWTTIEGFQQHLYDLYNELLDTLKVSYIYDLDIKKRDLLLLMAIEDLDFKNHIYCYKGLNNELYQTRKDTLKPLLLELLEEFESVQNQMVDEFISKLGKMLSTEQDSNRINYQFKWQANQKQLAELFATLVLEGWIANPLEQEQSSFATTLSAVFDVTPTYKKDNPNVAENLRQYLKPEISKARKRLTFPNCVTGNGIFSDFPNNNKLLISK